MIGILGSFLLNFGSLLGFWGLHEGFGVNLCGFGLFRYVGELISDAEADVREDDSYLFDLDNKVPFWVQIPPFWVELGPFWVWIGAILGQIGAILGLDWCHFGSNWSHFGSNLCRFGSELCNFESN